MAKRRGCQPSCILADTTRICFSLLVIKNALRRQGHSASEKAAMLCRKKQNFSAKGQLGLYFGPKSGSRWTARNTSLYRCRECVSAEKRILFTPHKTSAKQTASTVFMLQCIYIDAYSIFTFLKISNAGVLLWIFIPLDIRIQDGARLAEKRRQHKVFQLGVIDVIINVGI